MCILFDGALFIVLNLLLSDQVNESRRREEMLFHHKNITHSPFCDCILRELGQVGGLEPLMASLEVLHLCHNGISNMANLELCRLTGLKALFLEGTL